MDNNISEARHSYALVVGKFTQEDAAKWFSVSLGTYRNWEQGVGKLNGEILCNIAQKYGCSVDYLLCRTDDPRPYPKHGENHYSDPRQAAINGYFESVSDATKDKMVDTMELMADGVKARIEKSGGEPVDNSGAVG